jgi:ribosome production factor 2
MLQKKKAKEARQS